MHIHLIAVGTRMPAWVKAGYTEYAQRLPRECALHLVEIPLAPRTGHTKDVARLLRTEAERILAASPVGAHKVALDERGALWDTVTLAQQLTQWQQIGKPICLWIGGPDGFDPTCRAMADQQWSLSPLTLPHALVRIIVAEQMYRATSLLKGHPYHRPFS